MLESKVMEIGSEAISAKDPLLILFDETASDQLCKVSIIQRFSSLLPENYTLKEGSKIKFDDQEYIVKYVGALVKSNILMIGHATLNFKAVPEKPQQNSIYVEPYSLPKIKPGTIIKYC